VIYFIGLVASRLYRRMLLAFGLKHASERDYPLNAKSHRTAKRYRQTVEKHDGKKLDPAVVQACREYARDVFGWPGYAPWLCAYSAMAGEFREGWIPASYYMTVVLPRTKQDMRSLSDLRVLESRLFATDRFPTIACYANGFFTTRSLEFIPRDEVRKYLFQHSDRVVFKLHTSSQGLGVVMYTEKSFDVDAIIKAGNGVFQSYAKQHPFLDQFNPHSVANLRVTTVVNDNGEVSCRAALLRVATGTDPIGTAPKNIKIPIDLNSGKLHTRGFLPGWRAVTRHPDSGFEFGGATIPGFSKSLAVVCDLQEKLLFCPTIGWDICIGPDEETQIMEWNTKHNSIAISEATTGPCFADLGWENLWKAD